MFSGGMGNFTRDWEETEADMFAGRAVELGVPETAILVESESSNAGEDIKFSYKILEERKIIPNTVTLVQKPFMERRY